MLRTGDGPVRGIITGDLGLDREGQPKPGHAAGIALEAKYTLIAEGARGSLAKMVIGDFALDRDAFAAEVRAGHQGGLGDRGRPAPAGQGRPLSRLSARQWHRRGGFAYHAQDRKLYLGFVVHLDYADPTLSPFDEFQRFKTHPAIAPLLDGATRIAYGARSLTAADCRPFRTWPSRGRADRLRGGFMNAPRLKAIHNAILSGIGAADAVGERSRPAASRT